MVQGSKFLSIPLQGHGSEEGGYAAGGIFITQVVPQDPEKVVLPVLDAKPGQSVVSSVSVDTLDVRVYCRWEGTSEDWMGQVSINNELVPVENISSVGDSRLFVGYLNVTLDFSGNTDPLAGAIEVRHSSGRWNSIPVVVQPPGPEILSVTFGALPVGQSELKEGDVVQATILFNQQDVYSVTLFNSGASQGGTHTVTPDGDNKATIPVTIAARGDTLLNLGVTLQAKNHFLTLGGVFNSVATLPLNNLHPTISFGTITYPAGQQALKDDESASVVTNVADADTILITDNTRGDLTIAAPNTIASSVGVTRVGGGYRVTGLNIYMEATREANGSQDFAYGLVKIAHDPVTVSINGPSERLQSGGSYGSTIPNYQFDISCDQLLVSTPTLSPSAGTPTSVLGGGDSFNSRLQVHDTDPRGTFTWENLLAVNLAGRVTSVFTGDPTFAIGGFIKRVITIPALERISHFGATVADTAKLRCSNLSAGASGSYNYSYKGDNIDEPTTYTITNESGTVTPTGSYWYNLDKDNAESNTSGTARVEIEEIA